MLAFLTFSQYRSNMMHLKIKPDVVIIRHGQLMNIKKKTAQQDMWCLEPTPRVSSFLHLDLKNKCEQCECCIHINCNLMPAASGDTE